MTGTTAGHLPMLPVSEGGARRPDFVATHWSVVLAAGHSSPTRARDALEKLAQTYWFPLYAHVRRRGYSSPDAQDLTQEFFARLLEREFLAHADPERGRFRSFILKALDYFLATEWAKTQAQKRGGKCEFVSLDRLAAEDRYELEPADDRSPDKAFDKQWALALLEQVVSRLEQEYTRGGRGELFEALKQTLTGSRESQPYAVLASRLGMNEGAVKVAVHRLRKRYRELLQAEIAHTVGSPEQVEEEMRHLFQSLTGT